MVNGGEQAVAGAAHGLKVVAIKRPVGGRGAKTRGHFTEAECFTR
jgi:hypothetical protein